MAEVKKLIEGYREFYKKYFASGDTLYKDLQKGQSPKTLIIACSDSRVDPSIVTNAEPGDIFVIRNVANLVPPYQVDETGLHGVSSALEYAVLVLKVEHIVIMGHSNCGGIRSLVNNDAIRDTDFIWQWMDVLQPAKENVIMKYPGACEDDLCCMCEKESILHSLDNLLTFPWVKSKVESGDLKLHGWYFSLDDGSLMGYNPQTNKFENISTKSDYDQIN